MVKTTKALKTVSFFVDIRRAAKGGYSRVTIKGRPVSRLLTFSGLFNKQTTKRTFVVADREVGFILSRLAEGAEDMSEWTGVNVILSLNVQTYFYASPSV